MNRPLDAKKPLAASDVPGWVYTSGLMVGAYDDRWITGYSLSENRHRWWYEVDTPAAAPLGVFGSWVVVGLRDGSLLKLEALTGKKVWQTETPIDSFTERRVHLTGSTLLIMTAAQVLYAIDFQTGITRWLYDSGFPDRLTIRGGPTPIVSEQQVLIGTSGGEVQSISLETGKLSWRVIPMISERRFQGLVGEMHARDGRLLVTRYDGFVGAFDMRSPGRDKVWSRELSTITTSTYREGRYYVGCLNGDIYAFDEVTGRQIWKGSAFRPISSLTAGETTLLVAGTKGRVTALDLSSGRSLWFDDLGGDISSPPVFVENRVFYSTGVKALYGYLLP